MLVLCKYRCLSARPASCFEQSCEWSPGPPLHHWMLPPLPLSYPFHCCLPSGETCHLSRSCCGKDCTPSPFSWGECVLLTVAVWSKSCRPENHIFGSGDAVWSQWISGSSACIWRLPDRESKSMQSRNQVGGCLPAAGSTGSPRCDLSRPASPHMKGQTQRRTCVGCGSAIGSSIPHYHPHPPAGCPLKWQRRWHININPKYHMDS